MVRTYKKRLGSRTYGNFSEDQINNALSDVIDNGLSLRMAAKTQKISLGTLCNKYHGRRIKKTGGQPALSPVEETAIIKNILKCADWGYPLITTDLRMFVKSFLDKSGRFVSRFKNNLPGIDWVNGLLKRHRGIAGKRLASNISANRSQVSPDVIMKYFTNLEETVRGVRPENIFNYDESNVSDDPGKKLCIYRRGTKYPEKVCNHSKSATSLMICGSASGVLLPPYIIYKSENLWNSWTINGPKGSPCCNKGCCAFGARYNRTSHGWIDMATFNDWFTTTFLPHAKRLEGKKVLLGDNLASHFNPDVLRQCEENNITFVCLPPNSTNICQPLDVAFFRPFKESWRKTLTAWKMKHSKTSGIPKNEFPMLLKQTLDNMDNIPPKTPNENPSAVSRNLMSGFEACGVVPLNRDRVLAKLPREDTENIDGNVSSTLTDFLKNQRYGETSTVKRGRKMMKVEPGKSVSAPNLEESSDDDLDVDLQLDDNSDKENISTEIEDVPEYYSPDSDNIVRGCFVLVRFLSGSRKKTEFRYVCIVQEVFDDNEFQVLGLKSAGSKKTFKIVENDLSTVPFKEILAVLPQPRLEQISQRVKKYHFNSNINIKEC